MTSEDAEQVFTETCRLRPSGVVINMNHMGEPALKLVQRIVNDCPSTAVICASRDSSPDLILRSMRTGARDFIRLPINDEELATVIERTARFATEHVDIEPKKRGRAYRRVFTEGRLRHQPHRDEPRDDAKDADCARRSQSSVRRSGINARFETEVLTRRRS